MSLIGNSLLLSFFFRILNFLYTYEECIRLFRYLLYLSDGEVHILWWKNLHILLCFLVSWKVLESFFFFFGGGWPNKFRCILSFMYAICLRCTH